MPTTFTPEEFALIQNRFQEQLPAVPETEPAAEFDLAELQTKMREQPAGWSIQRKIEDIPDTAPDGSTLEADTRNWFQKNIYSYKSEPSAVTKMLRAKKDNRLSVYYAMDSEDKRAVSDWLDQGIERQALVDNPTPERSIELADIVKEHFESAKTEEEVNERLIQWRNKIAESNTITKKQAMAAAVRMGFSQARSDQLSDEIERKRIESEFAAEQTHVESLAKTLPAGESLRTAYVSSQVAKSHMEGLAYRLLEPLGSDLAEEAMDRASKLSAASAKRNLQQFTDSSAWWADLATHTLTNTLEMAPGIAIGGLGAGPAAPVIFGGMNAANQGLTEGRKAGLKGVDLSAYALTQGLIESSFEAIPMLLGVGAEAAAFRKVAQKGIRNLVKTVIKDVGGEMIFESGTSAMQLFHSGISGVDPSALTLESFKDEIEMTLASSFIISGAMSGMSARNNAKAQRLAEKMMLQTDMGLLTWMSKNPEIANKLAEKTDITRRDKDYKESGLPKMSKSERNDLVGRMSNIKNRIEAGGNLLKTQVEMGAQASPEAAGVDGFDKWMSEAPKVEETATAAPAAPEEESGQAAEVKMMITAKDKSDLRDLGYTEAEINAMKPEQAQKILETNVKEEPIDKPTEAPVEGAGEEGAGVVVGDEPGQVKKVDDSKESLPPEKKSEVDDVVLQEAFPGSKVSKSEDGKGWKVTFPGGSEVVAMMVNDIQADDIKSIMREYNISEAEAKRRAASGARGATLPGGLAFRLSDGTVVTNESVTMLFDANKADQTTIKHEAWHVAEELGFFGTPVGKKLLDSLMLDYGSVDEIIKARETWKGPEGLWERIKQWWAGVATKLRIKKRWDPDAALSETFTKRFWKQKPVGVQKTESDVMYQIAPPFNEKSGKYMEWYSDLGDKARNTLDFFSGALAEGYGQTMTVQRVEKGKKFSAKIPAFTSFETLSEWNKNVNRNQKLREAVQEVYKQLSPAQRKTMRINPDGTITETDFDKEFKIKTSFMQRLVDSMPNDRVPATMILPSGQKVDLDGTHGSLEVNGGESYRRALTQTRREQFLKGDLAQVKIGSLSKDNWGAMGFLAKNDKTIGSGDFTTVCPQMFYNKGCMYCYRRASLESGVNVKLAAERIWYTGDILRIKESDVTELNKLGGLRIQSFGDWMGQKDHAQFADMLLDAEARGLQVKIITKEPAMIEFVAHLKDQGLANNVFFNLSTDSLVEEAGKIGESKSWQPAHPTRPFKKTAEGRPVWKRALSVEEAAEYQKKYPWVNIRTVATSAPEFAKDLKDPRVNVVTGYHGHIKQPSIYMAHSEDASHPVEFEAVGDAGMPGFRGGKVLNRTIKHKKLSKRHQKLADAVREADVEQEYAEKACCVTGKCETCKTKCGVPNSAKKALRGEIRFPLKEDYLGTEQGGVKYQLVRSERTAEMERILPESDQEVSWKDLYAETGIIVLPPMWLKGARGVITSGKEAKAMWSDGATLSEIKDATGLLATWSDRKSEHGKPRGMLEVAEDDAKLVDGAWGKAATVSDLLTSPTLERHVPEVLNTAVEWKAGATGAAYLVGDTPVIQIDPSLTDSDAVVGGRLGIILHELQHAIAGAQKLPQGTSPVSLSAMFGPVSEKERDRAERYYLRSYGERMAYEAQARRSLTEEQRRDLPPNIVERPYVKYQLSSADSSLAGNRVLDFGTMPKSLDSVIGHTKVGYMTAQRNYKKAKHDGDSTAALRLVKSLVNDAKIQEIANIFGDEPFFVMPILGAETRGGRYNAIPVAYAYVLDKFIPNAFVNTDMVRLDGDQKTGVGFAERMEHGAGFEGLPDIPKDTPILIVDDAYTSGSTVIAAANHLVHAGHNVMAISAIATGRYGGGIKPRPGRVREFIKKIGLTKAKDKGEYNHVINQFTDAELLGLGNRLNNATETLAAIVTAGRRAKKTGPRGVARDASTPRRKYQKAVSYQLDITSIKNEVVDELRAQRGASEMQEVAPQTRQQWLDDAAATMQNDPWSGDRLVQEIQASPRVLNDRETALMQLHYRKKYNLFIVRSDELSEADKEGDPVKIAQAQTEANNQLAELSAIEEAARLAGREWGRAGVARQITLAKDFSEVGMLRKARVANGGEKLSDKEQAKIKKLAKTIERLEKRLAEETAKVEELETRDTVQSQIDEDVKAVKKSSVRRSASQAAKRKKAALSKVGKTLEGLGIVLKKKAPSSGIKYKVEEGGAAPAEEIDQEVYQSALEAAKVFADDGMTNGSAFWAAIKNEFGDGVSGYEATFKKAWQDVKGEAGIESLEIEADDPHVLSKEARRIQRELVKEGITDRDEIVDAVHSALQESVPDLTRQQAINALSKYGQFTVPSKEEVDVIIRDLNAQLLQISKQQDLEEALALAEKLRAEGVSEEDIAQRIVDEGLQLKATGFQMDKPGDVVRHLKAEVEEMKKRLPALPEAKEGQLQTALDAAKRATRNRINDLTWEIMNKERIVRDRKELAADEELKALRAERDLLTKVHKEMFPPRGATKEQKIAAALKATKRAIADIESRLEAGDISPKKAGPKLSTPELEAERARLEALRAEMEALRAEANPKMSPEERARRSYEANLRRRIAEYQERIANKDYGPREKPEPRKLSEPELILKKRLEDVHQEFLKLAGDYQLANLSPVGKFVDYTRETLYLSRAMMTSFDLSAVYRQGGLVVMGHPQLAMQAGETMIRALLSKQAEFDSAEAIRIDRLGQFAITAQLAITSNDGKLTRQEEAFMGRWAEKVPGVAASGRAYTTFLNNLRFLLFKQMVTNIGKGGQVTAAEAKVLAAFINMATGRSDLKIFGKKVEATFGMFAPLLNAVFFAPRYVLSRFQYALTPISIPFLKTSWRVKKAMALEYARTIGGTATAMGTVMALGYLWALGTGDDDKIPTIEIDPRSTDFLKIKIGETRIDMLAGMQQAMVVSARLAPGFLGGGKIKTASGEFKSLTHEEGKKGPYDQTRLDIIKRFLRTKMAPIPGAGATVWDDMTDVVGRKHTALSLTGQVFLPLALRDVYETMKAQGIPAGTAISILALMGMGVGTYGPRTKYLDATPSEREDLFKKALKRAKWDDGPLPYSDRLDEKQLKKHDLAKQNHAGKKIYALTNAEPKLDAKYRRTWGTLAKDKFSESHEKWKKSQDKAKEELQGYPRRDMVSMFNKYWTRPKSEGGLGKDIGTKAYFQRLARLRKLKPQE